ncbi:Translation initiation factor IF-1, chloroplastic [Linum grandiflorum]
MSSCSAARIHAPAAALKPTSSSILSAPRTVAVVSFGNSASSSSLGLNLTASRPARSATAARATKPSPTGEQKWTYEGSVTESLPNGMFRIRLDNEDLIIGYISGKIRKNFVRILPGDRVRVEVSRYDTTRGRIVYRIRNRDPNAD